MPSRRCKSIAVILALAVFSATTMAQVDIGDDPSAITLDQPGDIGALTGVLSFSSTRLIVQHKLQVADSVEITFERSRVGSNWIRYSGHLKFLPSQSKNLFRFGLNYTGSDAKPVFYPVENGTPEATSLTVTNMNQYDFFVHAISKMPGNIKSMLNTLTFVNFSVAQEKDAYCLRFDCVDSGGQTQRVQLSARLTGGFGPVTAQIL